MTARVGSAAHGHDHDRPASRSTTIADIPLPRHYSPHPARALPPSRLRRYYGASQSSGSSNRYNWDYVDDYQPYPPPRTADGNKGLTGAEVSSMCVREGKSEDGRGAGGESGDAGSLTVTVK